MRTCARAIILNEHGRLLVFERELQKAPFLSLHHYYSIPGGGLEPGETPEQAVVRELQEEMLVRIEPDRMIAHQIDEKDNRENFYFLARIVEGTPTFNPQSEEAHRNLLLHKNSYRIAWVDVRDPLLAYRRAYGQIGQLLSGWLEAKIFPTAPVDIRTENQ